MTKTKPGFEGVVWSLPKVLQGRYEDFKVIG